ncbi:MAG: hypothetical protein KIT16_00665 [Rhodospirillaceae bacterium]|nr:hypothetical protein [Rhodospirillaceae bacterium]
MKPARIGVLCAICSLAAPLAPWPAAAETVLRFDAGVPGDQPALRPVVASWIKAANDALKGKGGVSVVPAPGTPATDRLDLVKRGTVDLALADAVLGAGPAVATAVAEIPLNSRVGSARAHSIALWRTYTRFFAAKSEFAGVKLLGVVVTSSNQIFSATRPIKSLADLRGMKLRAGPGAAALVAALGAARVAAGGDGAIGPSWSALALEGGAARYGFFLPGGFSRTAFVLVANDRKWQSLPAEAQKALLGVSGEAFAARAGQTLDRLAAEANAQLLKRGLAIVYGSDDMRDTLAKRMPARFGDWMAAADRLGVDGKAAFDAYQRQIARALQR